MKPITLVRPSGEVTAKSPVVRKTLLGELAARLERRTGEVVRVKGPRLIVRGHHEKEAAREFGVAGALPGYEVKPRPQTVLKAFRRLLRDAPERIRLDVRSHHPNVSGRSLYDAARDLAEASGHTVTKSAPRVLLEVHDDAAYACGPEEPGPEGLPVGTQGTALTLLSGGLDSPVAAWMAMRRGLECRGLHLFVTESELKAAEENERILRRWDPGFKLHVDESHREFLETAEERLSGRLERYLCVVCKMRMIERACEWAERLGCECLITGDSLGQVASQTVWNLRLEERTARLPIFRPLIGMNKPEIVRYGRRIGIPQRDPGRCPFVPDRPIVKPREREALRAYRKVKEAR
ncbi:hypothetical protein [Methanopyrus sp.]